MIQDNVAGIRLTLTDMCSWVILMNCLASSALLGTECIDLDKSQ